MILKWNMMPVESDLWRMSGGHGPTLSCKKPLKCWRTLNIGELRVVSRIKETVPVSCYRSRMRSW